MKFKKFNKGVLSSSTGAFFWGFLGTYYFKYITFVGTLEVVIHRCIWTSLFLFITCLIFKKMNLVKKNLLNYKNLTVLFITSILIFANWTIWIYAVEKNKIIDASFGYFIFPIISVFFGYIFFKENLNKKKIFSLFLVLVSIIYLLVSFNEFPWIGVSVALLWSTYNLLRKKIDVDTDIGLFIESIFFTPVAIILFYYLYINNLNYFSLNDIPLMFLLILAGPMTVIPLFLYVYGVKLTGLGPSGMIFFITPTGQFLLGFFYYNEPFSVDKFLSFILIWFAVSIYLRDLYENN